MELDNWVLKARAKAHALEARSRGLAAAVDARLAEVLEQDELQGELDRALVRAPTWSAEWWSLLRRLDRVRARLIRMKGVQIHPRVRWTENGGAS